MKNLVGYLHTPRRGFERLRSGRPGGGGGGGVAQTRRLLTELVRKR